MIDKLVNLAKQSLGSKLNSDAGLNENQVEQTMDVAKESVFDGLKKEALGGNISGILNLFNGKEKPTQSNPIVTTISNMFVSKAVEKLGFGADKARLISGMVIPFIMEKFSSKDQTGEAKDEAGLMNMLGMDSDDAISGILSSFTKGGSGNSLLGNLFG